MASQYIYVEETDGFVLCQLNPDRKSCASFVQGRINLRGRRTRPVPKNYLARKHAPTVIWKPNASPDVTNAVGVEMVDLHGFGESVSGTLLTGLLFVALASTVVVGVYRAYYEKAR